MKRKRGKKRYQIEKLERASYLGYTSVESEPIDSYGGPGSDTISIYDLIDKINEIIDVVNG